MKKKILIIFLFVLFALPIPVAILGFGLSLIWFLGAVLKELSLVEIISALFGVIIGSTYLITYIFALRKTCKEKKLSRKTFLPFAHCLLALLYLLSLKPTADYISITTQYFGFAKKDFSVVEQLDTHEGFLGDGYYYLILDCSDNKEKALEILKDWNKLPLSENLNLLMYGGKRNGVTDWPGLADEAHMPKIENGYYMFEDRHLESEDNRDDSDLFDRYSYNFSLAVYDSDTDKMYYFAYDT